MQPRTSILTLLPLLACFACAVDDDGDLEFRVTAGSGGGTSAGTVFNTHHIEDVAFSELAPLGEEHLGLALERIILPGDVEAASFAVAGGGLVVFDGDGGKYTGAALIGSEWQLNVGNWLVHRSMWIDEYVPGEDAPGYVFIHESGGQVVRNCPEEPDGARILGGFTLDESNGDLTARPGNGFIACSSGAVGKAADWGYYDLAIAMGDLDVFETAIRVARADYCYDGASWTETGIPVIVETDLGLPSRVVGPVDKTDETALAGRPIEAVWGAEGLLCAGKARYEVDPASACPWLSLPACAPGATLADYPEGLILTRLP